MDRMGSALTEIHSVSSGIEEDELFYYVSDLHPEHQFSCAGRSSADLRKTIDRKIEELASSAEDVSCPLLVAGDTGDSFEIVSMVYEALLSHWQGDIYAVLGNHELWDTDGEENRSVDDVITSYKAFAEKHPRLHVLENELLIKERGSGWKILSEEQLLAMDPTAFWKLYGVSPYMILGGIGFSGMNPVFNAQTGAYRSKLTTEEDVGRSARLSRIHERLRLCAGAFRAVVLTHTPPQDWCDGRLCSNWIYVCGHTHRNSFDCPQDGPVILNDNQMGFSPCKWKLKAFAVDSYHEYDPLRYLPDGINRITADEYINFLRSSGIGIQSYSRQGTVYAVKHDSAYMFLLVGFDLYILNGGSIRVAGHPLSYYDEHLAQYISQVRRAFIPYDNEKKRLGREIRRLGGWGSDHGCIVDIDYYNHVYCDPRDGKMYFYYATDMVNKVLFRDFIHLIRESPKLSCRDTILQRLESGCNVPALLPAVKESALQSVAPEIVKDTGMYGPSWKMRSVQYVLEQKVIRFWQDEILNYDFPDDYSLPERKRIGESDDTDGEEA